MSVIWLSGSHLKKHGFKVDQGSDKNLRKVTMVEFKNGTKLLWEAVFMLLLPLVKWNIGWKSPDLNDSYQASEASQKCIASQKKRKKAENKPKKAKQKP